MEDPIRAGLTPELKVIETFGWTGADFPRLERHMARMKRTCARLGFPFARSKADAALAGLPGVPQRIRLTCDADGLLEVTAAAPGPSLPAWRAAIAGARLLAEDPWLRVKTTRRALYDRARAELAPDLQEALFLNTRGEVCEGTITNLFADLGDGLLTPPLSCGLLPGVLREELLAQGLCRERVLQLSDLKDAKLLFAGNSLRGLIRLELVSR